MKFFKPNTNFDFLRWRSISHTISVVLMLPVRRPDRVRGLNYGLDFTGGAPVEVQYEQSAAVADNARRLTEAAVSPVPSCRAWRHRRIRHPHRPARRRQAAATGEAGDAKVATTASPPTCSSAAGQACRCAHQAQRFRRARRSTELRRRRPGGGDLS